MKVELKKATVNDARCIWEMQVEAFSGLYTKYNDTETNPAAESLERMIERLEQPFTYYYIIEADSKSVGVIRIIDKGKGSAKRISPVFVLPEHRHKGIAGKAVLEAEKIHGGNCWELDTILQEEALCRFYEELGYKRTGKTEIINEKLTLVFYRKMRADERS